MQGLNLAVNFGNNTSLYYKKVVCPSSRSWKNGGTE